MTCSTSRNGRGRRVDDWWNYRDRKKIKTEYAERTQPHDRDDAELEPRHRGADLESVTAASNTRTSEVNNVLIRGTVSDYIITSTFDFKEGRFFNELESRGGANVVRDRLRCGRRAFPVRQPDRQIGADQWAAFQSDRRDFAARHISRACSVSIRSS